AWGGGGSGAMVPTGIIPSVRASRTLLVRRIPASRQARSVISCCSRQEAERMPTSKIWSGFLTASNEDPRRSEDPAVVAVGIDLDRGRGKADRVERLAD